MVVDEGHSDASTALLSLAETMLVGIKGATTVGTGAATLGQTLGILEYLVTAIYGFEADNEIMGQSKMQGMQMASTLAQNFIQDLPGVFWGSLSDGDPTTPSAVELTPRQKLCMADIGGSGHYINVNPVEFDIVTKKEVVVSYMGIWEDMSGGELVDVAEIDPGVKVVDRHAVYVAAGALSMVP